jgi:hypothetical protein
MGYYLAGLFAFALVCGLLGRWVAFQCGRETSEGFWLGFLFGPLGVVLEALLPHREYDEWRSKNA